MNLNKMCASSAHLIHGHYIYLHFNFNSQIDLIICSGIGVVYVYLLFGAAIPIGNGKYFSIIYI